MKRIALLIHFFICLGMGYVSHAQNASSDFKKSIAAYKEASNLSMDVKVYQYATKSDTKGNFVGDGKMRQQGDKYYSEFLDDEVVANGKLLLRIDHEAKEVHCMPQDKAQQELRESMQVVPDVDSLLCLEGVKVKYLGLKNGWKTYSIEQKEGMIRTTNISFDANNGFIQRIEYFYAPDTDEYSFGAYKIRIDYTSVSTKSPEKSWFDTSRVVKKNASGYTAQKNFQNYHIVNY